MATEAGQDLVEIVPNAKPPVCRIMDYGKFKFSQSKQKSTAKKKQKKTQSQQHIYQRMNDMDSRSRKNIKIGQKVAIVLKHHQRTGELTVGIVHRLLTNSPSHPHGIKVRLESGQVRRVKDIFEYFFKFFCWLIQYN